MITKLRLVFSITILFLSFYGSAQRNFWKQEALQNDVKGKMMKRFELKKGKAFTLDESAFKKGLESFPAAKNSFKTVYFPDEKGELVPFLVSEAQVLAPELAAKYPSIKSYKGRSLKNENDIIRFSVSHKGIQSTVVHGDGQPSTFLQKIDENAYIAYNRDANITEDIDFICDTKSIAAKQLQSTSQKLVNDKILRKFRLAVSASAEYTQFHGGEVVDALAAINATVTRINQVFERDLAVTLQLVANTDEVIFTDEEKDPYDGNLNSEVQNTLRNIIGEENYDIGHLFHDDDPGGNAGYVGSVCVDDKKGSAYASSPSPEGDLFDLDFVAHEMGHQLGANHTWSFESEGTQVQAEPASGTTIMGYAGITGVNNVASNGSDYFHHNSIVQISSYLASSGCAEIMSLDNNPPTIIPIGNFVIPRSTAFVLEGSASDPDSGDVISYTWEQIDDGVVTQATFGSTNPSGANFRSLPPSLSPKRYFPKLSSILSGNLTQTMPLVNSNWETVSDVGREMNFALTVRDNAVGGGQVVSDVVNIVVVGGAGPFSVTSQAESETYTAGDVQHIVWDVAETHKAPVLAQTVDILLSTDDGLTFPIVLAEDVPNDGDHKIIVPNNPTTKARIMVKAHENIFFAVNAANFSITASEILLDFPMLEYEVCQPDDLVITFNYETVLGFNEEATFSVVSPPPGLDITFFPETATSNDTSVDLILGNTGPVSENNYTIEVLATSASETKKVALEVSIYDDDFPNIALLSPANGLEDTSTGMPLEWESDSSYTSYDLEISTDTSFNTIVESATVFSNLYRPTELENATTYFWRVKPRNACGEGSFGSPFGFTTVQFSCKNKESDGLPIEITPIGKPTITSSITFLEDLPLADINVNLAVDHTFLSDLAISLTSPSGTTVVLVSSSCGDLENIDATFDDDADNFICDGNPAITGTVKPLGALDAFKGESILGKWILEVSDNVQSDGGALTAFSLDICVEGEFRPDDDKDGIYDDGDDACLGTAEGQEVDANGCAVYRFPSTNFSIAVQSESCRDNNDGQLSIIPQIDLEYSVTVTGNGVNISDDFSRAYRLENLSAGTYMACINGTDGSLKYLEHCFEVVVTQPESLEVTSKTSQDGKYVQLNLQGADIYTINLNGEVMQTGASELFLPLQNGSNSLKVSGDLPCQGVYEERFITSDQPFVYPNPFRASANIFLGKVVEKVEIAIYSASGQLVKSGDYIVNSAEMTLDCDALPAGMYFIKFKGENVQGTLKVIKQ
ncbi:reprolysin-like metallopeptidase [uncultured Kriegella sp.]|uniref:reprolysin-like metallopeptidase n=1 Tax=uncultured Kriegella sp. TaxID=1798910 RepID=UPI0030DD38C6|tara:strand:- start:3255 stop:7025 length:3771 start_codon:yes stop_codon:yes gene_type:complete